MSDVFVKHGSAPGAAAAEAAYLRWLREGSTAVVEVLELDETANTVTIERVDSCLLYTSPSPRDVEESRMPSSA